MQRTKSIFIIATIELHAIAPLNYTLAHAKAKQNKNIDKTENNSIPILDNLHKHWESEREKYKYLPHQLCNGNCDFAKQSTQKLAINSQWWWRSTRNCGNGMETEEKRREEKKHNNSKSMLDERRKSPC